jgi:ubiquinol-cytochrome c reductase cytochrome c subunit
LNGHGDARSLVALVASLVAYVASLGPGPPIPPVDTANGDLARGARLYEENCAACHSAAGTGGALTSGDVAPSLRAATPTQVGEAIRTGPGVMPSFSRSALDDHDVDSIAAYTQRLRHGGDAGGWATGRTGPLTEGLVGWLLGLGVLLWVIRRLGKRAGQ